MHAVRLVLLSAPVALGVQLFDFQGQHGQKAYSDETMMAEQQVESNRAMFTLASEAVSPHVKKGILAKVARSIINDKRGFFSHLNQSAREALAKKVAIEQDTSFIDVVAPPSPMSRPVLVPPTMEESQRWTSFLESGSFGSGSSEQQEDLRTSASFQDTMTELTEEAARSGLPWGVGSPRTGDSLPNFHYSAMPAIDFPKEWEYSLDSGDNIQSFSYAQQDVKLITQVLENITNGFYLDNNAGDGEHPSNTLLLETLGWRGLVMEPRAYHYLNLWSKMRKAWLFLGCMSPHENATKIGFDADGNMDMAHGHRIHSYSIRDFMEEMGGRTTVDFWNLRSGGYEAEILNETLLNSGKSIEFGVILVRFDGRQPGRGNEWWAQERNSKDTEAVLFEIMQNASFSYIGGLDVYWINKVINKYGYNDAVFVNPDYFKKRNLTTPTKIKAAPPPPISSTKLGYTSWDSGYDWKTEVKMVKAYMKKSKKDASRVEPLAKAHRIKVAKKVKSTNRIY